MFILLVHIYALLERSKCKSGDSLNSRKKILSSSWNFDKFYGLLSDYYRLTESWISEETIIIITIARKCNSKRQDTTPPEPVTRPKRWPTPPPTARFSHFFPSSFSIADFRNDRQRHRRHCCAFRLSGPHRRRRVRTKYHYLSALQFFDRPPLLYVRLIVTRERRACAQPPNDSAYYNAASWRNVSTENIKYIRSNLKAPKGFRHRGATDRQRSAARCRPRRPYTQPRVTAMVLLSRARVCVCVRRSWIYVTHASYNALCTV